MTGSSGVVGLLLAAGAGRRMGGPKALVGTWLADAVTGLRIGGCAGLDPDDPGAVVAADAEQSGQTSGHEARRTARGTLASRWRDREMVHGG